MSVYILTPSILNLLDVLLFIFIHLFQDTESKLLIMFKGEVSIIESLLLPPFNNQLVK